jgi:hypothetical protein
MLVWAVNPVAATGALVEAVPDAGPNTAGVLGLLPPAVAVPVCAVATLVFWTLTLELDWTVMGA